MFIQQAASEPDDFFFSFLLQRTFVIGYCSHMCESFLGFSLDRQIVISRVKKV